MRAGGLTRTGIVLLAGLCAMPARAAGGAHIVDDSEVESPRHCHLESWLTLNGRHGGLVNLSPACTPYGPGNLEIDTNVSYGWQDGVRQTLIGAGGKMTLRPESRGLGLGASLFASFDIGRRRFDSVTFNLPVAIPVTKALALAVNAGGVWSRTGQQWTMTTGAQAEYTLRPNLDWMAETFLRAGQHGGWQTGPRFTVGKGRIDIDLLASAYPDGVSPHAYTVGITVRR